MAYEPTTWNTGDVITAEKLNKMEQGIANEQVGPQGPQGEQGPAGVGLTGSATTIEAIATPESADAPTVANKVNEIITQLKARGITS